MNDSTRAHAEARRFFDDMAEDYRQRSQGLVYNVSSLSFRRRQDIVARMIAETPKGGVVLDYGMGPAVFGPVAARCGLRYTGIDISQKMVDLALRMNLPNSEFLVGDLDSLDRFHHSADTVLLIGLIDYLERPEEGLRKLAACVKDTGRLIMSFRNHRSIPRVVRTGARHVWSALRRREGAGYETAFESAVRENSFVPKRDLASLLKEEGFCHFRIEYLDCAPVLFNLPLPRLVWELWRRVDSVIACRALSFMCASGVLIADGKAPRRT